MKNLFNLKINSDQIYLIKKEVKLLDSIDKNLILNFKKILCKVNKKKINFHLCNENLNSKYLVSFLDNKKSNFFPIDDKNMWSNYNFFLNYFEFSEFKFDINAFQKIHLKLKRFFYLGKFNKFFSFLPLLILKPNLRNKSFFYKYLPTIKIKDASFLGNKHFMGSYCAHFKKTKYIKLGIEKVIQNLDDQLSKQNYNILLNKNTQINWKNYFDKATKNYQYSDYIKLDQNSVIINCGVGEGLELKLFNNVKKIFNVDPSKKKFLDKQVQYIIKNSKTKQFFVGKILYSEKGVYDVYKNKLITTLPKIIEEHNIKKIDLIKTDIEGAERFMIDDLIEILKKHNSQLAISIYHTYNSGLEDEKLLNYINIPLKIMNALRKNYKFYFNNYSYERWESILYCIPKKF